MAQMTKRRRWRPAKEALSGLRESVFLATGLKIVPDRLDNDEIGELQQLVREIAATADEKWVQRTDPGSLNDVAKLKAYERLVAKAASKPPDYFDRERERAAAAAAAAEKARQPKPHATPWEPGTIVIPAAVFRGVQAGDLPVLHAFVLVVVLAAIENNVGLHKHMTVEEGTVVVPAAEYLIGPIDEMGDVRHVRLALQELHDAGILRVEKKGDVRISLGPTLADELKRRD